MTSRPVYSPDPVYDARVQDIRYNPEYQRLQQQKETQKEIARIEQRQDQLRRQERIRDRQEREGRHDHHRDTSRSEGRRTIRSHRYEDRPGGPYRSHFFRNYLQDRRGSYKGDSRPRR